MASTRLNFVLDGRDQLTRVLDRAGDSATRLGRRLMTASINGEAAVSRLQRTATTRLAALDRSAYSSSKAISALKGAAISLAPAAIPAAAALAPIAVGAGAAAVAVAAFGAALGPQVSALGDAAEAEKKYADAVEESGENSEAAIKAQAAYARQMAKLPPATREAAAALSVLKDEYKDWSNSLAKDTMTPVTKGMAVLGAILPKLTPMVKGASREFDRLMTLAGGGVRSPGFDALMKRVEQFSTGTLRRANDQLVRFFRTADSGTVGGGFTEFMDYARAQGPLVAETLRNVSRGLTNLLVGASDVGVSMLELVNSLAKIAAAVPPGAITALLQLAIALKLVRLAAMGMAAARVAMAGFATQVLAMQAATGGTTGRMAALTASFGALSRGAKLALAGSGIGLLVIALSELSQMGKVAPPDVDKLTGSLKQLGATGKATGEAARAFGRDLDGLYGKVRALTDPSAVDDIQQFIVTLGGLGTWDSTPVKAAKENLDAVDKALANLVAGGQADLAAAAATRLSAEYGKGGRDTAAFTGALDDYQSALDNVKFEQQLAADSMGLFGQQAQQTKAKLDAQKLSADGLRQAIHALNQAHLMARGGIRGMEAAIDAATEAFTKNGQTLDENTEKGRANNQALDDLADATMKAVEAKYEETGSWSEAMKVYDRGRGKLVTVATQMTGNTAAAKRLADQILKTPDKTARLKGNLEDLQAKLNDAKARLARVPDARKAQIRAEISQLEAQIRRAKGAISSVKGKTVSVMIDYRTRNSGASDFAKSIGGYAGGGTPRAGEWAWVGEAGPELIHFKTGGARVYDHQTSMQMGAPTAGRPVSTGGGTGSGTTVVNNFTIQGAIDPTATAQQIQQILLRYQRGRGGDGLGF